MSVVDNLRREELAHMGLNPYLPVLSRCTKSRVVQKVTPQRIKNVSIQNPSRQRALSDARNAISCAATWLAVSDGFANGNFVHSWDECSVMLKAFNEKQTVMCTAAGRKKLAARNLTPATTEIQHQRRMLKLGISKHLYLKSLINCRHWFTEESYSIIADTNAHGLLECAIAMISDDNFTSCRSFKVLFKFMMMSM